MAMEKVPMTIEGFKKLEAELHRLKVEERPRIIQQISITSPIARALIGKAKGDSAEVTTPKGTRSYEILKIEYK